MYQTVLILITLVSTLSAELSSKNWHLENNATVQMTLDTQTLKVHGFSGCNNFFGSFNYDEKRLTFKPLASTRKMCPNTFMKLEQNILRQLSQTVYYQENNQTLTLLDANDKVLVRFDAI